MSKRKRFGVSEALTRGLSETIHVVENNAGVFRNAILPLSRIELDPDNPRKLVITLEDVRQGLNKNDPNYLRKSEELEKLKELAHTIQTNGVINPIVAYKRAEVYRIVAGERRCLASILAGKHEIDARIFNEKPKDFELKLIQWVENTAREDLTLSERIGNMRDILTEYENQHGTVAVNASLIKNITGLSLPQATYYLAVLEAPLDVWNVIDNGQLRSLDKAALLAGIESEELRRDAIKACIDGSSLKNLRKMLKEETDAKKIAVKPIVRPGRVVSKVNLGSTLKPKVAEIIIHAVLNQIEFKRFNNFFSKIDWKDINQVNSAVKKLINILEHEITG